MHEANFYIAVVSLETSYWLTDWKKTGFICNREHCVSQSVTIRQPLIEPLIGFTIPQVNICSIRKRRVMD